MKANEAPEKIYIYPSDRAGEEYETEWGDKPWGEDYVEYTRTDAFIEKAKEWLKLYILNHDDIDVFQIGEDFKNYMKGE